MASTESGLLVSGDVLAKLFNVSLRRIQQLAKDGTIPKGISRGKYDLGASVRGYVKFLQERAYGKGSGSTDYHTESTRVKKLTADKLELEIKQLEKELIPVEMAVAVWQAKVSSARAKFLSLPSKIASAVIAATEIHEVEEAIRDSIYEALTELAGLGIPEETLQRLESNGESLGAAAPANSKQVGRRKTKAKPRGERGAGTVAH
ncbi:MAG: hypothetical protein OEW37_00155 [Rhodospirillaceae bacterium]|nr:hypothetical protein [Rhodospirillaceae bacterium]